MPAASYPAQAARHLLAELRRRGVRVCSIEQAIQRGHLTELEWCDALDEFRERARRASAMQGHVTRGRVTAQMVETLRALEAQPLTRPALARLLGVGYEATRKRLDFLIAHGHVARRGGPHLAVYALTDAGRLVLFQHQAARHAKRSGRAA